MANSRLEKIGTIFSRVSSLLESGAMKEQDKPLWHSVYAAFPPKYEPKYNRPVTVKPIREILYEEDRIRAKFHQQYPRMTTINMLDPNHRSRTDQLLVIRRKLLNEGVPDSEVDDIAIAKLIDTVNEEKKARAKSKIKTDSTNKVEAKDGVQDEIESSVQYKPVRLSLNKLNLQELLQDNDTKEKND